MIIDPTLAEKNVSIATEYYKLLYGTEAKKANRVYTGGSTGFIPFKLNFTMDGISGFKIYQKLKINTSFLPPGYPDTSNFIITGISHKLNDHDWETNIQTVLIPRFEEFTKIITSDNFTYVAPTVQPIVTPPAGNAIGGNQKLATVLQNTGYTPGTFIYEWALVQGTIEGYGPASTIATRQNNPGNLTGASYPDIDPGSTRVGRFTKFSTPELGAKAMVEKFLIKWSKGLYPGTIVNAPGSGGNAYRSQWNVPPSLANIAGQSINLNMEQFYYIYAPPSENDTELYINNVVKSLQNKFPGFNRNEKLINWITR
jgi:hypothetical protein